MPRFFVKNNQINNDKITIIDEDVKHIKNVLRKQIGDKIEVCNQDTGNSYKCEIEIIAENSDMFYSEVVRLVMFFLIFYSVYPRFINL